MMDHRKQDLWDQNLNGPWEVSLDGRNYFTATAPGLVGNPNVMNDGPVRYRRTIPVPNGGFAAASLVLKGACFCPKVFIDGKLVSRQDGGMARTVHPIPAAAFTGPHAELMIELAPLGNVGPEDASYIPETSRWRTNVSCLLWDDCLLYFHRAVRFVRVVPFTFLPEKRLRVDFELDILDPGQLAEKVVAVVCNGKQILAQGEAVSVAHGCIHMDVSALEEWCPESPKCYRLRLACGADIFEATYGLRVFEAKDRGFWLNGNPVTLRAASVVWHRFLCDPEGRELAFDRAWFLENIVLRLKAHGANTLRIHLGTPPEWLLDLCDRHGLLVQAEWSFFHGLPASQSSMEAQWGHFLDMLAGHPCTGILHLWNESYLPHELEKGFAAIEALSARYPRQVISHRDVHHLHRYWWSLFENVGLYYESSGQFSQPLMADEFGGNYLDGYLNAGQYPVLGESFHRFLGASYTKADMLELQNESACRVAEYFRNIGAAGYSPVFALSSPKDGSHYFMGPLKFGIPKPVWAALTAAWAPASACLDLWDRNFLAGKTVDAPLHLYNETAQERTLRLELFVSGEYDRQAVGERRVLCHTLPPWSRREVRARFTLPQKAGRYRLNVLTVDGAPPLPHPIESTWRVFVLQQGATPLRGIRVALLAPGDEETLGAFLRRNGADVVPCDSSPHIAVGSAAAWEALCGGKLNKLCSALLRRGTAIVLLDIGERDLGMGYDDPTSVVTQPKVGQAHTARHRLFEGLELAFPLLAEPESCLHPTAYGAGLWQGLDRQQTWLWNGMKGGLLAPARGMEVLGLSQNAFLETWKQRGADPVQIAAGNYHAYSLEGHYEYSIGEDAGRGEALRSRLRAMAEDAPALAAAINCDSPVVHTNLSSAYAGCSGAVHTLRPLAVCGKGLCRAPLVEIWLKGCKAPLVLSQLLTRGRLAPTHKTESRAQPHYDPACERFVANLISGAAHRVKNPTGANTVPKTIHIEII